MPKPIEQVSLTKFRGASRTTIIPMDPQASLTVIFGENGTGKSAIVDAIDFAANGSEGSLADRSSAKAKDHMPTIGYKAKDLSVTLTTQEGSWTGTFSGAKPSVNGPKPGPKVHVLRRGPLAKLVEAQPAQRYEVLRTFIEVPAIERAEQQLDAALKNVQAKLTNLATQVRENLDGLTRLWVDEGRPGADARAWAESKASADTTLLDTALIAIKVLSTALDKAEATKDAYSTSLAAVKTAEDSVEAAQKAIAAAQGLDAQDAIALIGVLKSAQDYIAPPKQVSQCPVCEQPVDAARLRDDIATRLTAVQDLQELSAAQTKASQEFIVARSAHSENVARLLADASALLSLAKPSKCAAITGRRVTWDNFSALVSSPTEPALAPKAFEFVELIGLLRTALESERDAVQKDINQFNTLRGYSTKIKDGESKSASTEAVRDRLEAAFEIVREKRIAFVQAILDDVADECSRLYSLLHPNESLGGFKFWLDTQKKSSLHQNSEFEGHKDVPPQAYFSESHLDTLGFCVWLSVAKRQDPKKTIIILDDIFTSIDAPHLTNIVNVLTAESGSFLQMIVTTHFRTWRDRYRLGHGGGKNVQLIELHRWSLQRGIAASKTKLAVDELAQKLQTSPLDRQGVGSHAGILLEALLDRLALLYGCRVPHKRDADYTLGELWDGCAKLLKRLEIETEDPAPASGGTATRKIPILPYVGPIEALQFIRNQVGCHFSCVGPEISDTDVDAFGKATLELASAVMCPHCGDIASKNKGTHFACSCGKTKMMPLEFK
jgi:hypothetical protein